MKLNYPGLVGGIVRDPSHAQAVHVMQHIVNTIASKASKLAEFEDSLNRGAFDPCWAFAMCYASQLLIVHGDNGPLKDDGWFQKVAELKATLDKVSKRWKIAGEFLSQKAADAGGEPSC
jgi:hypothetical protein